MKGLLVDVMGTNCTNGGVTSGRTRALLVGPDIPQIFEPDDETPVLTLSVGAGGRVAAHPPGKRGMFGGHFIYSSDSRFPSEQPIHVHDRFEGEEHSS